MEKESSKECSDPFLWTNESLLLPNCLSRNSTLLYSRRIRALGLFWTNRGRRRRNLRHILYCMVLETAFWKGIFVFRKVSWAFSTFWHRRRRKTTKCAFEIDFFAMCSADLTYVNGSRIQLVLYANCFLGVTYGFLNKSFPELKLFICHCTIILSYRPRR